MKLNILSKILLLSTFTVLLLLSPAYALSQQKILVLNSCYLGEQFQNNCISAFITTLQKQKPTVNIVVETMDAKRYRKDKYLNGVLYDLYHYKYFNDRPDLLITMGNHALNFALKHRKTLFPDIPVLFCGINGFTTKMLGDEQNISGIVEKPNYIQTIKLALSIHPETQNIIAIADASLTGKLMMKEFTDSTEAADIPVPIILLRESSKEELAKTLARFDKNSTILFPLIWHKMPSGKILSDDEKNSFLAEQGFPIYTGYAHDVSKGALGGFVINGKQHGKLLADMAAKVLSGIDINTINILTESPGYYKFDYALLEKFNVQKNLLPVDTILINQPSSYLNKDIIITLRSIIIILVFTMAVLCWIMFKNNRTRQALQKSEQRLRTVQQIGQIGSWEYYPEKDRFWLSQGIKDVIGLPHLRDITLEDILQAIHPEDSGHIPGLLKKVYNTGKQSSTEFRIITGKKQIKYFYTTCSLLKTAWEQKIVGASFDITLRTLAQKALAQEKALLSAIIRSTPDILFFKDNDDIYLGCNKEFEKFTGRTEQFIIGKSDLQLFPRSEAEIYQKHDQAALKSGETRRNEEWITYPDGQKKLMDVLKTPYRGPDGEILGIIGVGRDITLLKQIEEDLSRERSLLLMTLASIGEGVISTDTSGNITFISNQACQITGWDRLQALKQPITQIVSTVSQDSQQPLPDILLNTPQSGTLANHTTLITKEKKQIKIFQSCSPLFREEELIGCVLVIKDVSELEFLENESLKVHKLESLGLLAGGIAHDFNNILSAILGNIEMARKLTKEGEKSQKLLANAQKATQRAVKLTQQLLTFAKGGSPIKESTSLPELIRESTNFILHGSSITTNFDFADNLWLVNADNGQLSQVIQNIVINANQAMPEGGEITITCTNIKKEHMGVLYDVLPTDCVQIRISDTGPGIPETIQSKIFDPYFSTKEQGSGLGLTICHSVISKHDGRIMLDNLYKNGTSILIYLPAESTAISCPIRQLPINYQYRTLKILVMDDEESIREIIKEQITFLGHEAELSSKGEEVIEHFRDNPQNIDIAILDLTIKGGMNGKETAEKLQEIAPDVKLIVSSGYSNDPIMANYRKYGFRAAIAKPFQTAELQQAIHQAMMS